METFTAGRSMRHESAFASAEHGGAKSVAGPVLSHVFAPVSPTLLLSCECSRLQAVWVRKVRGFVRTGARKHRDRRGLRPWITEHMRPWTAICVRGATVSDLRRSVRREENR